MLYTVYLKYVMVASQVKKIEVYAFLLNFWYLSCRYSYLVRLFFSYWAFKSHTVFKLRSSVCIHVSLPSLSLSLAVLQSPCGLLEVQRRCQQLRSCEKMTRVKRNKPDGLYRSSPNLGLLLAVAQAFIYPGHGSKCFLDFSIYRVLIPVLVYVQVSVR